MIYVSKFYGLCRRYSTSSPPLSSPTLIAFFEFFFVSVRHLHKWYFCQYLAKPRPGERSR